MSNPLKSLDLRSMGITLPKSSKPAKSFDVYIMFDSKGQINVPAVVRFPSGTSLEVVESHAVSVSANLLDPVRLKVFCCCGCGNWSDLDIFSYQ